MNKGCILIGCGPSLNAIDMHACSDFDTITFNRAYIAFDDWGFHPTYYACIDRVVLPDNAEEISQLIAEGRIRHFYLRNTAASLGMQEQHNVTFLNIREGASFSTDLKHLGMFGNVGAVSLQILAHLGYGKVVLIGVDARYAQHPPDIRVEKAYDYIHGTNDAIDYVHTENNDPNHFCPAYYGKGRRENRPNVSKAIVGWNKAAQACGAHGLQVVNATTGSDLQCFPHVPFTDAIKWLKR